MTSILLYRQRLDFSLALVFSLLVLPLALTSCSLVRKGVLQKETEASPQGLEQGNLQKGTALTKLQQLAKKPLSEEETKQVLGTATENFVYSPSLGETALDIAGIVLFPPYAILLAGQTVASLCGLEPIRAINLLPEKKDRTAYDSFMDTIYSPPGILASILSGEDYRSRKEVQKSWDELAENIESKRAENKIVAESPEVPSREMEVFLREAERLSRETNAYAKQDYSAQAGGQIEKRFAERELTESPY